MKSKGFLTSGFMEMVYAVLGVVLTISMFDSIMTGLTTLTGASYSVFIAWDTVIPITPTLLLLATVLGGGFAFTHGAYRSAGQDSTGMLRIVMAMLLLILFVNMMKTIADSFVTLYTSYGTNASWIAFGTVSSIVPVILFLLGIAGIIANAVGGAKTFYNRRKHSVT